MIYNKFCYVLATIFLGISVYYFYRFFSSGDSWSLIAGIANLFTTCIWGILIPYTGRKTRKHKESKIYSDLNLVKTAEVIPINRKELLDNYEV